ncbi:MAG: cupin [Brevundimonas sp.]|nr:MAG: cupin [Brevundimonas sp.]
MLTLDDLLHPITPAQFLADYDDRKPLYIPAGDDRRKREVLRWADFNGLLNQTTSWTPNTLRLVMNHQALPPERYCNLLQTMDGAVLRPSPAKMEALLATGASLVANDVMYLHAPLTAITAALGQAFGAKVGANVYCSFEGVQAFGTHFDNHDVFVIHTEGEKVWNLYQTRADNPVDLMPDTADTRRYFEQTRGPVLQRVTMRPGDVLYLPRGWYHDALAQDGGSLHVTFSVSPLYGRILLKLLDNAAMQDPAFRAYLPPAGRDGGAALGARLKALGQLLADLSASPAFREEVAMAQTQLVARPAGFTLPERKPMTRYRVAGFVFPRAAPGVQVAYDWMMQAREFAIEDAIAQIDFVSEADIRAGVQAAVATGALKAI